MAPEWSDLDDNGSWYSAADR